MNILAYEHKPVTPDEPPIAHTAIVFYGSHNQSISAVTKHTINDGVIGLGSIQSSDELSEFIIKQKSVKASNSFFIPESILLNSDSHLVWFSRRERKPIWFRSGKPVHFMVEWPPLLFIACKKDKKLKVLALSSNKRPTPQSNVYAAPLMNIYANHSLCQGTARLPENISVETIDQCESSLTDSVFTHVNHQKTLRNKKPVCNKQHIQYWKNKAKSGNRVKVSELTPAGKLADHLKGVCDE